MMPPKPVERFKLHLGNLGRSEKPPLPSGLSFKKAITDYLYEMGISYSQFKAINELTVLTNCLLIVTRQGNMILTALPLLAITKPFLQSITTTVTTRWPGINMLKNVLFVLTVPAEFSDEAKFIMRECAYEARLIGELKSPNLEFTTERN